MINYKLLIKSLNCLTITKEVPKKIIKMNLRGLVPEMEVMNTFIYHLSHLKIL